MPQGLEQLPETTCKRHRQHLTEAKGHARDQLQQRRGHRKPGSVAESSRGQTSTCGRRTQELIEEARSLPRSELGRSSPEHTSQGGFEAIVRKYVFLHCCDEYGLPSVS